MMPIDFYAINRAATADGRTLVQRLIPGGKIRSLEYTVLNPRRNDHNLGSFKINYRTGQWADFASGDKGGDFVSLVAYLNDINQSDAARRLADMIGFPVPRTNRFANDTDRSKASPPKATRPAGYETADGRAPPPNEDVTATPSSRSAPAIEPDSTSSFPVRIGPDASGKPKFIVAGDDGPHVAPTELRRHVYRRDGVPVRIKVKFKNGKFAGWYRVVDAGGSIGWQAGKPANYIDVPYVLHGANPFDREAAGDRIYWCEGEKDTDSVSRIGLFAFTFGGAGDGLPAAANRYIAGRHIVILADNDAPGRQHALAKAGIAHANAASVRIVEFTELARKGDVSDWIAQGGSGSDLEARADAAPLWLPPNANKTEAEKLVADVIDEAGELHDPLDELVEKTAKDPAAPYAPDVLNRLAALKMEDPGAFEALRPKLRKAGCRLTALDEAMAGEDEATHERRLKQADILIGLAQSAGLFRDPNGTGFADLDINGHRETWKIRSKGFKRWLTRLYFEATQGAPSSEALQSALNVIEATAHFDAPEHTVHIRVGGLDGRLYLDLCDATWRAVEIDATGWRVIENPPMRFRRAAGMQALPIPVPGGSVDTLRSFLNVQSDTDFVLVVAWTLAVLRNRGPYPVIVLSGEQGSAKSTFSEILRALLDPNTAPLRALPREDRDLFIAANNGHVLTFDNVSGLPAWISDTLCRLATGGGFAVRQLYTDEDEVLFDACRPVILNGIEDIVTRPDLADRGLFLALEPIPEERRRPEAELWAAFEVERPLILGVLLDAVVEGLKRLPETYLPKLPRMADFALWATACETALWSAGTFWSAYCSNRHEAVEGVIDADPIAAAVRTMMTMRTEWTGTASELLGALGEMAGERVVKSRTWPDSPRALSGRLRRAATFLRKLGIEIRFGREGRARTRTINITGTPSHSAAENAGAQPSAPSASSAPMSKSSPANGFADVPLRTVADDADGRADGSSLRRPQTVRPNTLKNNGATVADGADANRPPRPETEKTGIGWRWRL